MSKILFYVQNIRRTYEHVRLVESFMRYFVLTLALSLISLSFVIPDSYAGPPRGDSAEIVSDKEYFLPGDDVNLEIQLIILSPLKFLQ